MPADQRQPLLALRALKVLYGGNVAVNAVDIRLDSGEVVALVGANGAGKSSIMKALMGVVTSTSDEMSLGGVEMSRLATRERIKLGIALSPEGRAVFPELSVKENLSLGYLGPSAGVARDRLAETFRLFPKLQQRIGQMAGSLSGGEQQMLAIGRALMAGPKLLLLDEPTLGLAPIIVDEIAAFVQDIARTGVCVMLSEQNAAMALAVSDRAYVLSTGNLVLSGNSPDLLVNENVRRAYLGV